MGKRIDATTAEYIEALTVVWQTPNEIATKLGVSEERATKSLLTLTRLKLIERRSPKADQFRSLGQLQTE